MRWPWQRDRGVPPVADPGARAARAGAGGAATSASDATGAATSASSNASSSLSAAAPVSDPRAATESTAGWAFLPPLQRTVGPVELTSRPVAFLADLPTRAGLPFTGPMTHVVDHRAPSGVVDGDGDRSAPPVQRSADVDLTVLPPAPRAAAPVQRRTGGLVALDSAPAGTPRLRAVPVDPPAPDVPAPGAAAEPAAVADAADSGDGWTADGWAAPAVPGEVGSDGSWRDGAATTVPIASPPPAATAPTRTDSAAAVQRRVGLGAPISRSPLASTPPDLTLVQRDATSSPRASGGSTGGATDGATGGAGHGDGPGAPTAQRTVHDAVTGPAAAPADGWTGGPGRSSAERPPAAPRAPGGGGEVHAAATAAEPGAGAVQRATDAPGTAGPERATAPVDGAAVAQRSTGGAAVAQRSTGSAAVAQRSSDGAGGRVPDTAEASVVDARVQRAADPSDGLPAVRVDPPTRTGAPALELARPSSEGPSAGSAGADGPVGATGGAPDGSSTADVDARASGVGASGDRDGPNVQRVAGDPSTLGGSGARSAGTAPAASAPDHADVPDGSAATPVQPAAPRPAPSSADALAVVQRRTDGTARAAGGSSGGEAGATSDDPGAGTTGSDGSAPTLGDAAPLTGPAVDDVPGSVGSATGTPVTPGSAVDLTLAAPPTAVQRSTATVGPSTPTTVPDLDALSGGGTATATGDSPSTTATPAPATPDGPPASATSTTSTISTAPPATPASPTTAAPSVQRVLPGGPLVVPDGTPGTPGGPGDASGAARGRTGPAVSPGTPRTSAGPDLPVVARSVTGPDATGTAGRRATPTTGPGAALRVGPLLAAAPAPVQLADRRPPTLLAGQPAARRAVPVQRAVVGAPPPSAPRTGGPTLSAPVLDRTAGGATPSVGAVASRRAGSPASAEEGVGGDVSGDVAPAPDAAPTTGPDDAVPQPGADAVGALSLTSASASASAPTDGSLATLQRSSDVRRLATIQRATDGAPSWSARVAGTGLTGAPGAPATTDRPLTPLSPGGAGAPAGPTVSRSTAPVRAETVTATPVTTEVAGPTTLPLVQRRTEHPPTTGAPVPPVTTPTVQRSDDAPPPPPAPTPVAAPDAGGAAPEGSAASPFAAATPADLDELARRLMTPLMRRVRGQLLVDRERRGTRTDR